MKKINYGNLSEELITQIIKEYTEYLCRLRRLDSKRQRRF
jgi:hypothetical protein